MVGEDRIELSPQVPKTWMQTLHHTPFVRRSSSSGASLRLENLMRRRGLEPRIRRLRGDCCTRIARGARGKEAELEGLEPVIGLLDKQVPHLSATVP